MFAKKTGKNSKVDELICENMVRFQYYVCEKTLNALNRTKNEEYMREIEKKCNGEKWEYIYIYIMALL